MLHTFHYDSFISVYDAFLLYLRMESNIGCFKVQGQCVISTYERMRQKDCKFEDSQGHIETAVFMHASGCLTAGMLGLVPVLYQ